MSTNINVKFQSGIGTLTAKLFRSGMIIDNGTISHTGTITLPTSITNDRISLNGISTGGNTVIVISDSSGAPKMTTPRQTPSNYPPGPINDIYIIN